MRGIVEDSSGDLYAAGFNGFYHYDQKIKKWTRYPVTFKNNITVTPYALLDDGKDYIYISSGNIFPLHRFNKRKKSFDTDFYDRIGAPGTQNDLRILSLFRDKNNVIWMGSNNGLLHFDPVHRTFIRHQHDKYDIGRCVVHQIIQGHNPENFWVATDNGLFQIHIDKGIVSRLNKNTLPALPHNDIYCIDEDSSGRLWMGTNGGGIIVLSNDRKQVRQITRSLNGLCHDIVYGMLQQNDGRIWISTFNGLSCYDPEKDVFHNYYTADGLCANEFNKSSFLKARDGKMYFGGVNGISAFYPDHVPKNAGSSFSLFFSPLSEWKSERPGFNMVSNIKGNGEKIILSDADAALVFNLGLTDYTNPAANSFAYKVSGLFDYWVPIEGVPPVLRLSRVPYGQYSVAIKGINPKGVPAENTLNFNLIVKRPFYLTWWFYLTLLLLTGVMIAVFFAVKYRNLKNMQRLRLKIASNLHDEVGGLLAGISMFSDNLRFEDNTDLEKEVRLQKISELSQNATTSMSDILWAIDVRNDFSGNLLTRMREFAEELLLPMNIEFSLDSAAPTHRIKIPAEIRQQLYLIFKESVNNIIKHTKAGKVSVTYRYVDPDSFFFCITNDGVGKQSPGITGQGLKNMQMRAGWIGASMQHYNADGQFTITVQKGKPHIFM